MYRSRSDVLRVGRNRMKRGRARAMSTLILVIVLASSAVFVWIQTDGEFNLFSSDPGESRDLGTKSADDAINQQSGNASTETGQDGAGANPDIDKGTADGKEAGNNGEGTVGDDGKGTVGVIEKDTGNESEGQQEVVLTFAGDIMLGAKVEDLLQKHGYDYPYTYVKDSLQEADIAIANLESPITERGVAQEKEYVYRISPLAVPELALSGIDLVNMANNHILDYGPEGLLDTFEYLDEAGIKHMGAGHDKDEAYKPVYIEKNGLNIAFFGFSRVVPERSWKADKNHPGVASTYDYTFPVKAIEEAREASDLIVVVAHWGVEREDMPADHQVSLAHRYIDAGADLVVGGHPHVLQGFERYKDKWIAYSLGNFIFTTNNNAKTWETAILNATCSLSQGCQLKVKPVLTKWAQPKPMEELGGIKLLQRISDISIHVKINSDGEVVPAEQLVGELR